MALKVFLLIAVADDHDCKDTHVEIGRGKRGKQQKRAAPSSHSMSSQLKESAWLEIRDSIRPIADPFPDGPFQRASAFSKLHI